MQQPASFPLVTRRWALLWIAATVYCAFRSVALHQDGRTIGAIYWAATGLVGIHLFVRSLRPQRQLTADQARHRALVGALQLIVLSFGFGTLAIARAGQVSGGVRVALIIWAVALYGLSAWLIVKTVVGRRRSAASADTDDRGSD